MNVTGSQEIQFGHVCAGTLCDLCGLYPLGEKVQEEMERSYILLPVTPGVMHDSYLVFLTSTVTKYWQEFSKFYGTLKKFSIWI